MRKSVYEVFMFSLLSYGEALVDFLPNDANDGYYPMAGGAPANVAVAYAKLGSPGYFAGGISTDNFGSMLLQALEKEGVDTSYVRQNEQANTAVVLVSLDSDGERSFNFYRHETADTFYDHIDIDAIDWQSLGIFHFCSNTLTNTEMYKNTLYALKSARDSKTLVSFDVNLRQQLWTDLALLPERVEACLKESELVKLSKEEAEYLAQQKQVSYQEYITHVLSLGCKLVVITDGPNDVQVVSSTFSEFISVPTIKAIDTTAGGDSFIAGFLYSLAEQTSSSSIHGSLIELDKVINAVGFAAKCGAFTCQNKGAFVALPTLAQVK